MPCEDSSSRIKVRVDGADRLLSFDYNKMTCSKSIGGEASYLTIVRGKQIRKIVELGLHEVLAALNISDPDDQFLLFLEWDALRTALLRYLGEDDEIDPERYQIASVQYDGETAEIVQVIRPPKAMPAIIACTLKK